MAPAGIPRFEFRLHLAGPGRLLDVGHVLWRRQGGFIVFGLSFMVLAAIVDKVGTKWIDVLFPPAAMGSIVAIIGLELAPLAMNMSGYMGEVQGMSNETAMIISTFTLVVTILATVLGRGFIGIIPILIGVIAGYILSFFMGVVDWTMSRKCLGLPSRPSTNQNLISVPS